MAYRGGASSALALQGDGWFSFSVPGGVAGVYVGLVDVDASIDPSEHTHSLVFTPGGVRVHENGVVLWVSSLMAASTVFSIVRFAGRVFYCKAAEGALPVTDPRIPFAIPGTVVFASPQPVYGPVYLDATLTAPGDSVANAAIHDELTYNESRVKFRPMGAVGFGGAGDVNIARAKFEPLTAVGAQGNGAQCKFSPMQVQMAAAGEYNAARATSAPLAVVATSYYEARVGAYLYAEYPLARSGAPGTMLAEGRATFRPMGLRAGNYELNDGRATFAPLTVDAGGRHSGVPAFDITIPAFIGTLPAPTALDVLGGQATGSDTLYPTGYVMWESEAVADDEFSGGATYTLNLESEAVGVDSLTVLSGGFLLDAGDLVADDEVLLASAELLEDDGAVGDSDLWPATDSRMDLSDAAVATDDVYPATLTDIADAGDGVADDALTLETAALFDDSAIAEDSVFDGTVSGFLLDVSAVADDDLTVQVVSGVFVDAGAPVADTSTGLDVGSVGVADDETFTGVATEPAVDTSTGLDVGSVGVADDETFTGVATEPAVDTSTGAGSPEPPGDHPSTGPGTRPSADSVAVADDATFTKQAGLVAWVMNAHTGAVSWYDNWAFTSMATVGGKVFAAGPEGLSVIGGDMDGADTIDARIDFGWQEFGGYTREGQPKPLDAKKRVQGLWFGYHSDGEMTASVETYGQGYGPYSYSMAARSANQPRNNRIVPGKGLNSRYWRISLANNAGCNFELHSIAAETINSSRRL